MIHHGVLMTDGGGEKDTGLGGRSGAELDKCKERCGIGAVGFGGKRDDVIGMGGKDFPLGAGEIVLRKFGDLFEETRT